MARNHYSLPSHLCSLYEDVSRKQHEVSQSTAQLTLHKPMPIPMDSQPDHFVHQKNL
jgi:hypothetical protein